MRAESSIDFDGLTQKKKLCELQFLQHRTVLQCDGLSLLSSHGSTHVMTSSPTKLGKQRENNNDAQEVCRTFKQIFKKMTGTPLDRINHDQT